ncbi:TolC family outer membrane protein [Croceibacterium ferulae]|uniref:TolC family outer membrane protein n=1 Tax=Croceibacterium ferulae TaxID=1854641 RepID=UPI000EB2CF81|nr:TolC family outer membrane protein [Croceibacterium ferulae]
MPARADTLEQALIAAYTNNPTLNAARADQRAVDENVAIQRSFGRPSVNASVTITEFLKQAQTNFVNPDRAVNGGLDLAVPLFQGGAVRNGIRAAQERVAAGRADLRSTESVVFSQVVTAYMDVIGNEAIVALSANQVEVLEINLQATSDRFEIGDLTRTDVAQSESRLAVAQGDLENARANLVSARERYIQLVGLAPTDLQPPPPLADLPALVDDAVDVAVQNNPDVIAAIERAEAAGFDIRVVSADRLPRVDAFTQGGYQNFLGTLGSIPGEQEAQQSNTSLQAGLRLTVPLYQGGLAAARRRQSQAQAASALENAVAIERDVVQQARSAFSNWRAALAVIESSQVAVEAAELSLEGVQAENTVGNRTILDILDAQRELLIAQVDLVSARRNAYVAAFTLLAAMGRAEARDLGLADDVPFYDPADNYERVAGKWWDWDTDPDPVVQSPRTVDIPAQSADVPTEDQPGSGAQEILEDTNKGEQPAVVPQP